MPVKLIAQTNAPSDATLVIASAVVFSGRKMSSVSGCNNAAQMKSHNVLNEWEELVLNSGKSRTRSSICLHGDGENGTVY
jgi:hypothetical protein